MQLAIGKLLLMALCFRGLAVILRKYYKKELRINCLDSYRTMRVWHSFLKLY
jgi:hypothetical protein